MVDFLIEYGMFSAKVLTCILLAVAGILLIALGLSQRTRKEHESIEIEKLNDTFDEARDALEKEIYSKNELKVIRKKRKKAEKAQAKTTSPRLFVIRFDGDLQANDVYNLRECINTILSTATTEDEILVILDSGGGYVHNYGLAASQLARIRERKIPLTVSIDLVAASGGYLMACVANKILAAPFAIIGSIGVLAQVPNFHRLLKKHDVDVEQHTAGEYKRTLTLFGENTTKAREKFKEELEETHQLFKEFVSHYRPQLVIEKVATGEHWYGTQALQHKLIDSLTTSDDYLLKKSSDHDIYEISYVVHETLVDKISILFHGVTNRLLTLIKGSYPL